MSTLMKIRQTAALTRVRHSTVCYNFRYENSKWPDIGLDGEAIVIRSLWSCPFDWKPGTNASLILIILQIKTPSNWRRALDHSRAQTCRNIKHDYWFIMPPITPTCRSWGVHRLKQWAIVLHVRCGAVEGQCRYPKYFFWGMPFSQIISGQGERWYSSVPTNRTAKKWSLGETEQLFY